MFKRSFCLILGKFSRDQQNYQVEDELHDTIADLGYQMRKLVFGSNYNLIARYFKLMEIEGML